MKLPFQRRSNELNDELQSHFEMAVRERIERGEDPQHARETVRREFGNRDLVRETTRDTWGWRWVENLVQDVRFGARMLRKNPGFTIVAVLTLALGIGANTAIFSVVNAILLRPLAYPDSGRIAFVFLQNRSLGIARGGLGYADFLALQREQQSFTAVAALRGTDNGFTLTGAGEAAEIPGSQVSADFFNVMGVKPVLGRTFEPKDGDLASPDTVVVSFAFWKQHMDGDPAAIGRSITLDQKPYAVIGVMPAEFHFGDFGSDQLWPIMAIVDIHQRPPYFLHVVGRLKPGATTASATADETRIAADVSRQYPTSGAVFGNVVPMKELIVGDSTTALYALLGAVLLVLLIAVVNVANLQVARAASRNREMAMRAVLGAGKLRLARQLLAESILLGAIGAALGLFLAYRGIDALIALSPNLLPRANEIAVDGRVLAFTAGVALVSSVLFGLAPVLSIRGARLDESLKQGGRSAAGSAASRATHRILVVAEFSLALVLLAGAGLLLRSLARLEAVSPGFEPQHIVTAQVNLPPARYKKPEQVTSFYQQLLDKIGNAPGVAATGITMSLPPNLLEVSNPFHLEGQPYTGENAVQLAEEIPISENYFSALGVPLVAGRFFEPGDRMSGQHVLIVNRTMAQAYFPGSEAVGKRIQTGDADPSSTWCTIVGVVGDVKYQGLDHKSEPTIYVPHYDEGWNPWFTRSMSIVVRTRNRVPQTASALREAVASLDRDVPVSKISTMDELISASVGAPRFWTSLLATFALLALVLAAVGAYGVMSYTVTRRTQEIGVMVALGGQRNHILGMILGQGARLALVGVAIGLAAAFAVTRLIASLLYGVTARDPISFVGAALVLLFVAELACYIPARRAMRVDPMVALRYE
jgi:predicted permease